MTYTHLTKFTLDSPMLIKEIIQEFSKNPEFSSIRVDKFGAFHFEVTKRDCENIQILGPDLQTAYLQLLSIRNTIMEQEHPDFWKAFFVEALCPEKCPSMDEYLASLSEKCRISLP